MPIPKSFPIFAAQVRMVPLLFLNFNRMIRVIVFLNREAWCNRKCVLERQIEWSQDILFPIDSAIKTFKALYGPSAIISFEFE